MTEPYQDLANAIILMAVKDYRDALKKLKKRPFYGPAQDMKNEVERFFHSDWYRELTSVDGNVLIKKLQAEVSEQ
ncbi:hypothetical protein AOC36_06790 [Erysipelothrix larvae]|uniref:Uncharacterized protein n=1 Tax=Erysipelothrix larvae TaxID=1514105 RepID=A0A0X8H099_9FIRM|nr:hypothetical protein [Erysipelothrix larvae]AMC93698.1 hypothetical protein AOC36_06790 [Erysipelothrix larvae]